LRAAVRGGSESLPCEWPAVVALDHHCSGTLVHPEVVVYAAHCGTGIRNVSFGEDADQPERVIETRRCEAHPEAALGNGFDVAFCLLAEPVVDIPSLPIAAGCELDTVRPGLNATLVGFGFEREGGAFGIKRSASVVIGQTGADLIVEPAAAGTCAGDSGGPLVMELPSAPGAPQPRVLGISSAASVRECEPSTEHYSYAPALLPWLESESGRDLTPCFSNDSSWAPTARCAASAAPSTESRWSTGCGNRSEAPELLATCGAPFSPELLLETTPPDLELMEPEMTELTAVDDEGNEAEMSVEAVAWDAESGVAEVRFEIRDEHGVVHHEERDEVPPYQIEHVRLAPGTWELAVSALDHASNQRQMSRSLVIAGRAELILTDGAECALRSVRKPRDRSATWLAVLALSAFGWYRRSTRAY
jgi:hypothetical protein